MRLSRQVLMPVCAGLFSAVLFSAGMGCQKESPSVAAREPALSIDGHDLWEAYMANEIRADQQYKGKTLEIIGDVISVNREAITLRTAIGSLAPKGPMILCRPDPSAVQDFAAIQADQVVAVIGVCVGARQWDSVPGYGDMVVVLEDCRPGDLKRASERTKRVKW